MSTTTPAADTRFLRRVLVFLVAATLASGAMMAYAAASMSWFSWRFYASTAVRGKLQQ